LHGVHELEHGPPADSVARVRRNVWHAEQAERRVELQAATQSQLVFAFRAPPVNGGCVAGRATRGPEYALTRDGIWFVYRKIALAE
jgi:hypothetical protein